LTFGEKIRKLRHSAGLTQEEVASRADLARSFISQIESDKTSPTLDNLGRILTALGTDFRSFFSEIKKERIVYQKEERVPMYDLPEGVTAQMLMDSVEDKKIDPVWITLKPGARTEEEDYHEGDEFGYVIQGEVLLVLDDKKYRLKSGDSFYYQANKTHYISNPSKKTVVTLLWIKID